MISVTRLNNSVLIVNAEAIQSIEANPDTVITFINRDRLIVKELVEEVMWRILQYRRSLKQTISPLPTHSDGHMKQALQ
jgi:flagellar protein FlbD